MEAHNIGIKHKRKEENKNCTIGLSPMKPQFSQFVEHPSDDMISGKKSKEGLSERRESESLWGCVCNWITSIENCLYIELVESDVILSFIRGNYKLYDRKEYTNPEDP
ncbi:hypothetical protein H5410_051901 [Solanum commersonii]|uniref:Uncharacterized protein n=1 Tax=Solanum commersonii TaxID=4109 RepID=A0A9J5WZU2_SOLCO|nr:hypothetical protein H5410_051901 [Solanum commersonii]